ncbi:WXG100 family type VII secretion target [Micromonospora sp. DT31]|uniref:WXG100 family type VII secretion target n=1 Tax=Micromonospora sp. DT31 TaxID=3393434 RepID=UPI003CF6DF3D
MAPVDGQIVYNFGTISEAVASIDTAVRSMNGTLDQLARDLSPLESSAWSSEAQAAYKIRKDRWTTASNHIVMILGQVKVSLAAGADRMQQTDRRAVNYF